MADVIVLVIVAALIMFAGMGAGVEVHLQRVREAQRRLEERRKSPQLLREKIDEIDEVMRRVEAATTPEELDEIRRQFGSG